jgi:hypothetical protein
VFLTVPPTVEYTLGSIFTVPELVEKYNEQKRLRWLIGEVRRVRGLASVPFFMVYQQCFGTRFML